MQRFLLFLIFFSSIRLGYAQTISKFDVGYAYLKAASSTQAYTESDISDLYISSEVYSPKTKMTYLYLNQAIDKIPIRNAMAVLAIDNDNTVQHMSENFIVNAKSKVLNKDATISAIEAIYSSAKHLGIPLKSPIQSLGRSDQGISKFSASEFTKTEIPVSLKYDINAEGNLVLVWNMSLDMRNSADYWDYNVDAQTGALVSKHNYTVYCTHHKDNYKKHKCMLDEVRKVEEKKVHKSQFNTFAPQYNVFALPAESPNHGERSIVTDGQYPDASPYGWHDVNGEEGPEFTITRGNNVHAYQDKDDDDAPDGTPTDGGEGLSFDFGLDMSLDPRESADAAVTNLFYMVNMMHDIAYKTGFTEEFGNFQDKNYTGADGENDYVLAQAFDGITLHENNQDQDNPKINNANFSTPSDGFNGRMQMFFWDNESGSVFIESPESLRGFVDEYGAAQFGLPIPQDDEPPITGKIAVAVDGSPSTPTQACNTIVNPDDIAGKVALIDRGLCNFSQKVYRAQQAGAIAAIICNVVGADGNGENVIGMSGAAFADQVLIPSVFFKKSDCDKIRFLLENNEDVEITFYVRERVGAEYFDGALDNGIIAHEFGHGISNRLTGGRSNSSCLNNDEQMGEGWSDFFSLVTTHEPGDTKEDIRGIGTFAIGQSTRGGGIRRYPYSSDFNINPQTFDDIKGTTAPHPLGEVWAASLWDLYWAFVDAYGFDSDWNNEESGNFKAVQLVMEGMKIQPCRPGFIQGRDALLAADRLLYDGQHICTIWNIFARRGLGYYAEGGSTDNRNDGVEDYEPLPTCIEKLKIKKTVTSSVDPGATIDVVLNTINHIPARQSNVVVTDELPDGLTYVEGSSNIEPRIENNTLYFDLGDMEYEANVDISYQLQTDPERISEQIYLDDLEGDINWDTPINDGNEFWTINYDINHSPEISLSIFNVPAESDAELVSLVSYPISGKNPALRFWHYFNIEPGIDGGFVEISENGGPFKIIPSSQFIRNPYTGPMAYGTLAIPSLEAFSGSSGEQWIDSYIDLTPYVGSEITVKFRFGSNDSGIGSGEYIGWAVDDIAVVDLYIYEAAACISAEGDNTTQECTELAETIVNSTIIINTEDAPLKSGLKVVANPIHDQLVVECSVQESITAVLTLQNLQGNTMWQQKIDLASGTDRYTFDTSYLPAGVYILVMDTVSGKQIRKIVKQ